MTDHDIRLPAAPASVGDARRFVGGQLLDLDACSVSEIAALLTSELVTNAIVHAGGPVRVYVTVHAGTVRVTVEDTSTARPHRRRSPQSAVTGRGLALVERLSERWGVGDLDGSPGKAVWFELRP